MHALCTAGHVSHSGDRGLSGLSLTVTRFERDGGWHRGAARSR